MVQASTSIMNGASDEPYSVNVQLTPDEYRALRDNLDRWPSADAQILRQEFEHMERRHNARFKEEYEL